MYRPKYSVEVIRDECTNLENIWRNESASSQNFRTDYKSLLRKDQRWTCHRENSDEFDLYSHFRKHYEIQRICQVKKSTKKITDGYGKSQTYEMMKTFNLRISECSQNVEEYIFETNVDKISKRI